MVKRKPTPGKPRAIDGLNRVVLPGEVREALGVASGDYLVFKVEGKRAYMVPVDWEERP
jgi:AbrB family looped-hinge helix DNA binding protein